MAVDKVSLIYNLHDGLLEFLCGEAAQRHTGVAAAARDLKQQRRITGSLCNTLTKFDHHPVSSETPVRRGRTVIDVTGSMKSDAYDDAHSDSTQYPSSLADLYEHSWTIDQGNGAEASHIADPQPVGRCDAFADVLASPPLDHDSCYDDHNDHCHSNAVLTPRSNTSAPPVARRLQRKVRARRGTNSVGNVHKWVPKDMPLAAKVEDDVVDPEPSSSGSWSCPCGFKNTSSNTRCGGSGRLGCKRARFLPREFDPSPVRSRSPRHGRDAKLQDKVIESALDQLKCGLSRVHVDGIPGPVIRIILRARPDLFTITDKVSAKGARAFNVALTTSSQPHECNSDKQLPVGGYHRAVNPFRGGRI